jgi:hypothetical protein
LRFAEDILTQAVENKAARKKEEDGGHGRGGGNKMA